MIAVREYVDDANRNEYRKWFDGLDVMAAAKVAVALERMALGHQSSIAPVGEGVSEYKIDWGPGYRIYFGKDGGHLVILLGGGSKKRQDEDIEAAKAAWREYKRRKSEALKQAEAKTKTETKKKATLKKKRK